MLSTTPLAETSKLAPLYDQVAAILTRKPRRPPDVWARENRRYPTTAGVPGPRDPSLTPYVIAPARAAVECRYKRVVAVFAAQSGKTDSILDIIGERLDERPVPIIYVGPTKDFLINQFEPRIMQLLDDTPALADKVARGKRMKKVRKEIGGVPLRLAHAGSPTALKSDPVGLAILDEYVDMKRNVRGAGDPLSLAEARGETYADFMTLIISTPSEGVVEIVIDPASGLAMWSGDPANVACPQFRLFLEGTRRHFCWRCKDCRRFFVPRFALLRWVKGSTPAQAWRNAWVQCPRCEAEYRGNDKQKLDCAGRHFEEDKRALNAGGIYVAPGQEIVDGVAVGDPPDAMGDSYWASGLCSPFKTFGDRAQAFLSVARVNDVEKIRGVINQNFGELWTPRGGDTPELAQVASTRAPYKMGGDIPVGVRVITGAVDVQKNRLIFSVRGWGVRGESWLLDHGEFYGKTDDGFVGTDQPEVWSDLADYFEAGINGTNRRARLVLIDSGFRPNKNDSGVVSIVYDFCRAHQRWARPAKGSSFPLRQPVRMSRLEVKPSGQSAKYGLDLVLIDPDFAKLWVHERLVWPQDVPGSWHLPEDIPDEYLAQLISESRLRLAGGKVEWKQTRRDNHALDIEAMNFAAGYILNAHRIPDSRRERRTAVRGESPTTTQQAEMPAAPAQEPQRRPKPKRRWATTTRL